MVRGILRRAGVDADTYRSPALARRLPALLRALRVSNLGAAAAAVAADPAALARAVDTLMVGVTEFFRDAPVFQALDGEILPERLAHRPRPRVWSVGCSSGAELYSMAILLAERGRLDGSELYGTDCRRSAVAAAREGVFHTGDVRNVAPPLLERYFRRAPADAGTGGGPAYRVIASLRDRARWDAADAFTTAVQPGWDVILCRNLTIYLNPSAGAALWARLAGALSPGGILVVGRAERPTERCLTRRGPCIYQKNSI